MPSLRRTTASLLRVVSLSAILINPTALAAFNGRDNTWWVDTSCAGKLGGAVEEAFATGQMIWDRLPGDNPSLMQTSPAANAFKTLFARDSEEFWYLGQAATETLSNTFGGGPHALAKFSKNNINQLEAEIRIYCDNDARFEKRKDDPKQPPNAGKKNSERDPVDEMEYIDPVNNMVIKGMPNCWSPLKNVAGVAYGRLGPGMASDSQHPKRVGITLCDKYLKRPNRINTFTDDIPKKKTFTKGTDHTINNVKFVTSMVLFHELMHHSRYAKDDVPEGDKAYGWDNCIDKSDADAENNADNWAILATLVQCLERKFWIDPKAPKLGKLLWNKEIPDRPASAPKQAKARELLDWLPGASHMKRHIIGSKPHPLGSLVHLAS